MLRDFLRPPILTSASRFLHDLCNVATTLRCGNIRATTFTCPFKDQAGAWHNGTSFGLNDLDALMNVASEAKEWMTAHTLKR